jgi:L-ascorbate metabolism protein UlaG (beta-lactamase superfamily)
MRLGDLDYAFLPVNAPLVDLPHRRPGSPRGAVMSPAEAAAAASILQAGEAIPIHYDTIHNPPVYAQTEDPAGQFLAAAEALGVSARAVAPGEIVTEGAPAPA